MFKIVMIVAVAGLAIAWAVYGYFEYKARQEEKNQPRPVSERLQKTRSEITDWAKKMAEYQPPKRPKSTDQEDQMKSS